VKRRVFDIAAQRMRRQRIEGAGFASPEEVVTAQLAVQAQDYLGGLWALGLRMRKASEALVEQALAERRIVRSWPLRGTLHFVAAEDVRWLLDIAAPRVLQRHRRRLLDEFDIDDKDCTQARKVCERVLAGGRALTRDALYAAFDAARIVTEGQRGLHLTWSLAQQGVLCLGAREGKQHTFVLLDEWLPPMRRLARDDALAELARRYFTSRGPATVQDFCWWSGLSAADAAAAFALVRSEFECERIEAREFWFAPLATSKRAPPSSRIHLLPAYDEYTVAYNDRSAVLDAAHAKRSGNGIFKPAVLIDGRIAGTWKRELGKNSVALTAQPFGSWDAEQRAAFEQAAARYAAFLDRKSLVARIAKA
jgi:hypothetical protein